MRVHWTYARFEPTADLQQGDLLVPTGELRAILSEVHPHFCADKYLGFAVATQSCDLVRRGDRSPRAKYICIAVVRSLKQVLPRLLSQVAKPVADGVFRNSSKLEVKRFLGRLFDQNEQSLGLFYLHSDADVGVAEPAVVFLRITVSLRVQHYEAMLEARRGRLTQEFQGKFGWLLGNLYSRVAAHDWAEMSGGEAQLRNMIEEHLEEQLPGAGPIWIDDEVYDAAVENKVQFAERKRDELMRDLERCRPAPRIERIVDAVLAEATRVLDPEDEQSVRLRNRLLNNGTLRKLLK